MGNPYLDWALMAVILAAFCLIALCFTRLVFRWWSRRGTRGWRYGRATWQALYNAACLHALPGSTGHVAKPAALEAIQLLRLAISDPGCELDRPSERMATDPSLHWLREFEEFAGFARRAPRSWRSYAAGERWAGLVARIWLT